MKPSLEGMGVSIGVGACAGGACYLLLLVLSCLPESVLKGLQITAGAFQIYNGINDISSALK